MRMTFSPNWEELKSLLKKCSDLSTNENEVERPTGASQENAIDKKVLYEGVFEVISQLIEEVSKLQKRVECIELQLQKLVSGETSKDLKDKGGISMTPSPTNYSVAKVEELRNSIKNIREQIKLLKGKRSFEEER